MGWSYQLRGGRLSPPGPTWRQFVSIPPSVEGPVLYYMLYYAISFSWLGVNSRMLNKAHVCELSGSVQMFRLNRTWRSTNRNRLWTSHTESTCTGVHSITSYTWFCLQPSSRSWVCWRFFCLRILEKRSASVRLLIIRYHIWAKIAFINTQPQLLDSLLYGLKK